MAELQFALKLMTKMRRTLRLKMKALRKAGKKEEAARLKETRNKTKAPKKRYKENLKRVKKQSPEKALENAAYIWN